MNFIEAVKMATGGSKIIRDGGGYIYHRDGELYWEKGGRYFPDVSSILGPWKIYEEKKIDFFGAMIMMSQGLCMINTTSDLTYRISGNELQMRLDGSDCWAKSKNSPSDFDDSNWAKGEI